MSRGLTGSSLLRSCKHDPPAADVGFSPLITEQSELSQIDPMHSDGLLCQAGSSGTPNTSLWVAQPTATVHLKHKSAVGKDSNADN